MLKVIIPLAGFGTRMRPHTWSRAKPLLHVAGNTIIGHLLNLMSEITTEEVIFVVGDKGDEIEAWIRQNYPHLNAHFVVQEEPLNQAQAIGLCRDYLDVGEVLVAFGDNIVNAHFEQIAELDAGGVILVEEGDEADPITALLETTDASMLTGVYWFRNGRALLAASQQSQTMLDICRHIQAQGKIIKTKPALFCLRIDEPNDLLEANKRLLGLGYGSEDAIDRSYGEDFTALPPVFIHEDATVSNSVIGPYVSIGAGANIQDSIVRNSIVDGGTAVTDCILDSALIGENAKITGKGKTLFVGDNAIVNL
jgi:glucose-1-phosphate thymidylyltransferase